MCSVREIGECRVIQEEEDLAEDADEEQGAPTTPPAAEGNAQEQDAPTTPPASDGNAQGQDAPTTPPAAEGNAQEQDEATTPSAAEGHAGKSDEPAAAGAEMDQPDGARDVPVVANRGGTRAERGTADVRQHDSTARAEGTDDTSREDVTAMSMEECVQKFMDLFMAGDGPMDRRLTQVLCTVDDYTFKSEHIGENNEFTDRCKHAFAEDGDDAHMVEAEGKDGMDDEDTFGM